MYYYAAYFLEIMDSWVSGLNHLRAKEESLTGTARSNRRTIRQIKVPDDRLRHW